MLNKDINKFSKKIYFGITFINVSIKGENVFIDGPYILIKNLGWAKILNFGMLYSSKIMLG